MIDLNICMTSTILIVNINCRIVTYRKQIIIDDLHTWHARDDARERGQKEANDETMPAR